MHCTCLSFLAIQLGGAVGAATAAVACLIGAGFALGGPTRAAAEARPMMEAFVSAPCHTECVCRRCEVTQTGAFAYEEIAATLGTDDDTRIYPVWLATCRQRVRLHAQQRVATVAA